MMKRLSMFVALACLGLAVPMCVQADDQYVTYDGTTYKVVGDNLVTNPTFETTADQNDANAYTVEGWIAGDGTTITSTYFTVSEEEDATTGGKTLKFLGSDGSSSAQSLGTLWQVDPSKTYYLSIWTKNGNDSGSGTETILINDNNSTNDGSGNSGNEQHIMHITNTSSTFVQTVLVITPSDYAVDDYADVTYNYLGLRLARVGGESQDFEISNVELYEVEEVSADPENPLDITSSVLVNPDGSSANASDGWTTKQDFSYGPSTTYTNGDANLTSSFFEVYDATQLGDKTMSQTITLPAGEYRLTADAIAVLQSSHLTPVTGVSLYAGEAESTSISTYDGVPETFSVDFAVEPEDQATTAQVEVGVKVASTNANWVAVDNFKLYYLGSELSYEVFELTALVTEASELVDAIGVTDADLSAAISAAQEALGDDQSDAETLADALSTLQDALQAYKIANASEDYPVDMTESLGYWTGGSNYGSVAQLEENFDAAMETGTKLSQTISDLPAGVYEVKLYCVANYANDVEADGTPNSPTGASEGDNVVTVKANDATTAVTLSLKSASNASKPEYAVSSLDDMDIITVSNAIVEEDGTLSLSISVDVANAVNWILVGNYSLTYLGAAEEEEEEPADFTYLNNALEDAQTLELTSETAYTDGVTVSEDADATQSDVDAATEALAKLIQQNGTASEETVEITETSTDTNGDVVEGETKTYRKVGANLIANPNFRYGIACWTHETTLDKDGNETSEDAGNLTDRVLAAIDWDNFAVNQDDEGGYYISGLSSQGTATAASLTTVWQIDPTKTYYFSCKTYDVTSSNSTFDLNTHANSQGGPSEVMALKNAEQSWAQKSVVFNASEAYYSNGFEPTVDYTELTSDDDFYALIRAAYAYDNNNNVGASFTDFELCEVEEVTETASDDEYAEGDIITIGKAQYKVLGENLFTNGGFEDGVNGWTSDTSFSTDAVATDYTLNEDGGFNDGAYISSSNTLTQAINVTEGSTYVFIAYTSGYTPANDSNDNRTYNGLFNVKDENSTLSTDGLVTEFSWGADPAETAEDWTQTLGAFKATSDIVGVRLSYLNSTKFDGFQLYEVEPVETVGDTEYSVDDVVTIDDVMYTIKSENLVQNGGFEDETSALTSWTTGTTSDGNNYSATPDESNFTITSAGGFNGKQFVSEIADQGINHTTALTQAISVTNGTSYLFIGYTSGKTPSSNNIQFSGLVPLTFESDVYTEVTKDSSTDPDMITSLNWGADAGNTVCWWTETDNVFEATSDYVGIRLCWTTGSFDGLQLYEVEQTTFTVDDVKEALEDVTVPTANIGTDAFQYDEDLVDALSSAVSTAQAMVDDQSGTEYTSAECYEAIVALQEAAAAAAVLNEPEDGQVFNIIMESTDNDKTGNALESIYDANKTNGGKYDFQFLAEPNANLAAQLYTFTPVEDVTNGYTISFVASDGNTYYLCAATEYDDTYLADGIRATDGTNTTADNALTVVVKATDTEGVWNLYNPARDNNLGLTTDGKSLASGSSNADLALTEAPSEIEWTLEADYGTLMLPFVPTSDETEGLTFYSTSAYSSEPELALEEVETLEANTPYIVGGTEGTYTFAVKTRTFDTEATAGWLTGVYESTSVPTDSYVLQNQTDEGLAFYIVTEDAAISLGANHCYLTVTSTSDETTGEGNVEETNAPAVVYFPGSGKATAITGVEANVADTEAVYDLSGRKVSRPQHGIYIKGGKKVVIK